MTLTEFLRARLDEDERHARKLAESDRRPVLSLATTVNHPERLLLEVEAKRRIVETHRHADYSFGNSQAECPSMPRPLVESAILRDMAGCDTLLLLAAIYADHDDYDEGWRP